MTKTITILSIDPGQATGWVLVRLTPGEVPELLDCGISQPYEVDEKLTEALNSFAGYLIVEKPPTQGNSPMLTTLFGSLTSMAWPNKTTDTPYPGAWKPWAARFPLRMPEQIRKSKELRHCRDAYKMGLWYAVAHLNVRIREDGTVRL